MATLQDHMRSGMAHCYSLLDAVEADRGEDEAMAFLAGLVCACARRNTQKRGTQSTFDLLQGMIDETMDPQVAVQCLEAELRAFVERERKKWKQ